MSTIKSSAEDLTLNADGSGNDIIFQSNGSNVATLDQAGLLTATSFAGSAASLTAIPAANITGTLPAIDGSNLTGVAGLSSQYVSFTRDSSSGAGTSSVTGVGFQPTAVLFLAAISGAGMASIGFEDSDRAGESIVDRQLMTADDWDTGAWNARPINIVYASTVNYDGRITSYDADGFTITWSERGSPSGTIKIRALCFK